MAKRGNKTCNLPALAALQVINTVFDASTPTGSSGLGLTAPPAPAAPAPAAPAAAPTPQSAPAPVQPQQHPRPAASSSPSKYTGFGNDNSGSTGPDHKPLASYFTNTPPPPAQSSSTSHAGVSAAQGDSA